MMCTTLLRATPARSSISTTSAGVDGLPSKYTPCGFTCTEGVDAPRSTIFSVTHPPPARQMHAAAHARTAALTIAAPRSDTASKKNFLHPCGILRGVDPYAFVICSDNRYPGAHP